MTKSDIVIGGIYDNGKGRIRTILDIGAFKADCGGRTYSDNVLFKIASQSGKRSVMTRAAFAKWAKFRRTDLEAQS